MSDIQIKQKNFLEALSLSSKSLKIQQLHSNQIDPVHMKNTQEKIKMIQEKFRRDTVTRSL